MTKTWEIQVYNRQVWHGSYYYSTNGQWYDTTEEELVDADYFDLLPNGSLVLWNGDRKSLPANEEGTPILSWQSVVIVAAYHSNQWLSICEYIAPEEITEEDE